MNFFEAYRNGTRMLFLVTERAGDIGSQMVRLLIEEKNTQSVRS